MKRMLAMPPPLPDQICIACRKPMAKLPFRFPAICGDCWQSMTLAEKAARQEAWELNRRLFELKQAVDNNEHLSRQTARLAKALEALLRELKEPFSGLQNLIDRWNRRIEQDQQEYDDGEAWKRGKSEDDD